MAGQMKNTLVEHLSKVLRDLSDAMTGADVDDGDLQFLTEMQGQLVGYMKQAQSPGGTAGMAGDPMAGGGGMQAPADMMGGMMGDPMGGGGGMPPELEAIMGPAGGGGMDAIMGAGGGGGAGMGGQPPNLDEIRRMMG